MRHHRTPRPLTIAAATAAVVVAAAGVTASAGTDTARLSVDQRQLIYDGTKDYRDVEVALAAGYVPAGECVEDPDASGAMGYHYVNPELASDTVVDPAQPELLVYQLAGEGDLRLVAVEYFVADADQDLATNDDLPSLFGEFPFNGPMPGHDEEMPIHYDLHVWLYRHNPAGQLEDWNPRVSCP